MVDTCDLEDAELDLAVAHAIGMSDCEIEEDGICWQHDPPDTSTTGYGGKILALEFTPSISWYQGGPLIEIYDIHLSPNRFGPEAPDSIKWQSVIFGINDEKWIIKGGSEGPTPLISAMRAIVYFELNKKNFMNKQH